MLIIIALMLGGIGLGWLLRKRQLKRLPMVITFLIWVLLFLLGLQVGANPEIIQGLFTLGVDAIIISILCTLGSCFAAMLLYKKFR